MSATLKQGLLVAAGGVVLAFAVLVLARRRLMTLRYTIGWLGLAALASSSLSSPASSPPSATPSG